MCIRDRLMILFVWSQNAMSLCSWSCLFDHRMQWSFPHDPVCLITECYDPLLMILFVWYQNDIILCSWSCLSDHRMLWSIGHVPVCLITECYDPLLMFLFAWSRNTVILWSWSCLSDHRMLTECQIVAVRTRASRDKLCNAKHQAQNRSSGEHSSVVTQLWRRTAMTQAASPSQCTRTRLLQGIQWKRWFLIRD